MSSRAAASLSCSILRMESVWQGVPLDGWCFLMDGAFATISSSPLFLVDILVIRVVAVIPFFPSTAITFVTSVIIVPLLFLYVSVVVVAAVGVCVGASEKLSIVTWLWLNALLVVVLSISCCALVLCSRSPLLDVCLFCFFVFFLFMGT